MTSAPTAPSRDVGIDPSGSSGPCPETNARPGRSAGQSRTQGNGSAREVYGWLVENCPGMEKHLLFTFSTVAEPEVRSFLQEKNVPCLVKPFEVADLIAHARRLMQKAHAASAS